MKNEKPTLLEIRKLNEKKYIDSKQFKIYDSDDEKYYSKIQVGVLNAEKEYFCIETYYSILQKKYPNDYFIHIVDEYDFIRFYTVGLLKKIQWIFFPRKYFKL